MSDVTPVQLQDEIMDAFATFWAGRSQIASPNRDFDRAKVPETDPAYITWGILGQDGGESRYSHSLARNNFSRAGTITFVASVRLREGLDPALELLNDASLFLEAVVVPHAIFSGIGTPIPLGDDGAWSQVSLSANWLYFTDRPSSL